MANRKKPGRSLSGEELDPVLLGKHLGLTSQLDSNNAPRKAIGAPQATSRRGGKRRPPPRKKPNGGCGSGDDGSNNNSSSSLGAFVENNNASFKEIHGDKVDVCEQTVDSRQLLKGKSGSGGERNKRAGRRPIQEDDDGHDTD